MRSTARLGYGNYVRLAAIALIAALVGCSQEDTSDESSGSSDALIFGNLAVDGELRSVLQLGNETDGFCTAAKVGDRFILTAAHCVLKDPADRGECATGRGDVPSACERVAVWNTGKIRLRVRGESGERWVDHEVEAVRVPRPVLDECQAGACFWDMGTHVATPDIALIEVKRAIEDAVTAKVDIRPQAPGTPIVVLGYGCVRSSSRWIGDDKLRQRESFLTALSDYPNSAFRDGRSLDRAGLEASYLFSSSRGADRSEPGLCSGDSGGPLLAATGEVIGVNAYYIQRPTGETMTVNMFTRVDPGAAVGVTDWLKSRLPASSLLAR